MQLKYSRRARHMQALVGILVLGLVACLLAWRQQLKERYFWFTNVRAHVLTVAAERALKPKESFKECNDCPEMVVLPAGEFMMGSSRDEEDHDDSEDPQHKVTIAGAFAVSRFAVTFDEWDACVVYGGCPNAEDGGFGRSKRPVINIGWDDAKHYVEWLTKETGKRYRLLSEVEWEYAARAGTTTRYYFGDDENDFCRYGNGADQAMKNAHPGRGWESVLPCDDGYVYTAPVGRFLPNAFDLYDMLGNVWQWVEDCYHDSYAGAPSDDAAWTTEDCSRRVVRGGSWLDGAQDLRSASRKSYARDGRILSLGLRVGRTLTH